MSRRLIDRNPDLKRLRDEGYHVEVLNGHLVVRDVPYLNSRREICRGVLVSTLALANDTTMRPDTHVAMFSGEYPCHGTGQPIERIRHSDNGVQIGEGLRVNLSFSAKPQPCGYYQNYYDKLSTYVDILSGPAQSIDPTVTAKTFPLVQEEGAASVFKYVDTASSRAGITAISQKLESGKVAIVGLGGTGSYVLDLLAKTPVGEIHLYDGDLFLQHNAFRAPGAPSSEELDQKMPKVLYLQRMYGRMRDGIIAHPEYASTETVSQLSGMSFVFLCMEGRRKEEIVRGLEQNSVPFIDVGIGIYAAGDSLGGLVRITTSTPTQRDHVWTSKRIPFSDATDDNEYSRNIQIADLNALNAALAVIKWKKLRGFYVDQEHEHYSTYTLGGNELDNEDKSA
jgi:hypothetical protein